MRPLRARGLLFGLFALLISSLATHLAACGECRRDPDCQNDQLCRQGRCVSFSTTPCQSHQECPSSHLCQSGRCTPLTQPDSGPPPAPDAPPAPSQCPSPGQKRPCYTGPQGTSGVGECKRGFQICQNGFWTPCAGFTLPNSEVCDGKDNDCDGQTDESLTRPCGSQTGACTQGSQSCTAGQWSTSCVGEIKAQPEICDGKDNDCNGKLDDVQGQTCACQDGQSRSCGSDQGECQRGTQRCQNGQWSTQCAGETKPTAEVCDGKDNDCNGKTDDLQSCPEGQYLRGSKGSTLYLCRGGLKIPYTSELAVLCREGSQPTDTKTWRDSCLDNIPTGKALDASPCLQTIYRFTYPKAAHHYYTTDPNYSRSGYVSFGPSFRVLNKALPGASSCRLFTNWNGRDSIISCGNGSEETNLISIGYKAVELLGYAPTGAVGQSVTFLGQSFGHLYRSYNPKTHEHFFTPSASLHNQYLKQGYRGEGGSCKVLPP